MNLAEELFVCGIDEKGNPTATPATLGAGVAAELILAKRARLDENGLTLLDDAPTGDPLLDRALRQLAEPYVATMTPDDVVLMLGIDAAPLVRQSVVEEGAVTTEKSKRRWLGLPKPDLYRLTPVGEEARHRLAGDERAAALAQVIAASRP